MVKPAHRPLQHDRSLSRDLVVSRRDVLCLGGVSALSLLAAGCGQRARASQAPVVVYTSIDDFIARPIAQAISQMAPLVQAGITINLVTDTEATKTTGLLQRLLAERTNPQCDIWWSNEALATSLLAREGVLQPLPTQAVPDDLAAMPAPLKPLRTSHWQGYALRSRVIAFSTSVFATGTAPATLDELFARVKPGRLAMAQPQFGTTRSFFAHLVSRHGEAWTRDLCAKLRGHNVRLLPGNSAVVRAIAQGSADAGLTDSDDVFVGQREGWKVDFASAPAITDASELDDARLLIPCTVGLVAKSASSEHAARVAQVAQALLSREAERRLALSEALHRPVREDLARELGNSDPRLARIPAGPHADWQPIASSAAASDALLAREFPV